jgi:CHAD domain-containing protein
MAFRFEITDRNVTEALQRIAQEEFAAARAAIGRTDQPLAERVHALRKTVKKLRGLLRLVRPVLGGARAEIAALGEAGRGIATLRDAEVLCRTLDGLIDRSTLPETARAALRAPFADLLAAEIAESSLAPRLERFAQALEAIAARAPLWQVREPGFAALAPGLRRTAGEARAALAALGRHPGAEAVHDWRKRVKDHWYQARLLAPIWPAMMAPHVAAADTLGEVLGLHNDLAVLRARLASRDDLPAGPVAVVDALARIAQEEHLARALPLGRSLLADRPKALARRWGTWWEVWRGGAG